MRSPAAKLLLALGGVLLACCAFRARHAPAEREFARVDPPPPSRPRPEPSQPSRPPADNRPRQTPWTADLDAVSRLPEGAAREARFSRLLAATTPENYAALGDRIAACSLESDWRAEAGSFVTAWCAHAPLDATAWLLQRGSRLDTATAAQAARTLVVANPDELSLLLDLAPSNWSKDQLLAAAADACLARSPEAALRWLSSLRDDAPYRPAALHAVAAELARRDDGG